MIRKKDNRLLSELAQVFHVLLGSEFPVTAPLNVLRTETGPPTFLFVSQYTARRLMSRSTDTQFPT